MISTNDTFYGRGIPNTMRKDTVPQRVSHYKLLSTNIADAEKLLTRIKCGKYFGNLKENDIIYAANKSNNTVVELEISATAQGDGPISQPDAIRVDGKDKWYSFPSGQSQNAQ